MYSIEEGREEGRFSRRKPPLWLRRNQWAHSSGATTTARGRLGQQQQQEDEGVDVVQYSTTEEQRGGSTVNVLYSVL
jgi:hypothetical protein